MQAGRKPVEGQTRVPGPARSAPLDPEIDREIARDDPPSAFESEGEGVAVRAELELEVAIASAQQEELDDLVVPEPVVSARRTGGRRVAVTRRLDLDLDRVPEAKLDSPVLIREERFAVPCAA